MAGEPQLWFALPNWHLIDNQRHIAIISPQVDFSYVETIISFAVQVPRLSINNCFDRYGPYCCGKRLVHVTSVVTNSWG